jgi:hypothetical protein
MHIFIYDIHRTLTVVDVSVPPSTPSTTASKPASKLWMKSEDLTEQTKKEDTSPILGLDHGPRRDRDSSVQEWMDKRDALLLKWHENEVLDVSETWSKCATPQAKVTMVPNTHTHRHTHTHTYTHSHMYTHSASRAARSLAGTWRASTVKWRIS